MTIDGYVDVAEEESALFCAVLNQPISVGIDGGAWDFQLYTSVSIISASFIIHIYEMWTLGIFLRGDIHILVLNKTYRRNQLQSQPNSNFNFMF